MPNTHTKTPLRKGFLRSLIRWLVIGVALLWSLAALILVAARWIDPPTTAVHIQRRLQAWIHHTPYRERYKFIPLSQISPDLQHAVIAAEDAHFYQHHGFDWHEIQIAAEDDLEGDRTRGASTITQQLVKNLFFGTGRSILRKGAEVTLVPVAEFVLGKQRILEIYLNVVEWGPGIYGAESACRYYDETAARNIGRQQAARLAAILPAPLKRRPERMNNYSAIILKRMAKWVGNRALLQMPTVICADRLVRFGKIQVGALPSRGRRKLTTAEYAVTSTNSAVARYGSIIRI
jgi:monofunctional glycosyltransferase